MVVLFVSFLSSSSLEDEETDFLKLGGSSAESAAVVISGTLFDGILALLLLDYLDVDGVDDVIQTKCSLMDILSVSAKGMSESMVMLL